MQQFKTRIISKQKLKEFTEISTRWKNDWNEMNRVLLILFEIDLKEIKKHLFFPKAYAQQTALRAVKKGKIKKLPPLKVIFLCASCHQKEHWKLKREKQAIQKSLEL